MDGSPSDEQALHQLLVSLYGEGGLRRLVRFRFGKAVADELPGAGSSVAELALAIVQHGRRRGLLDADFFEALAEEVPGRRRDIVEVARRWVPAWAEAERDYLPPPRPPAPTTRDRWQAFLAYAGPDQAQADRLWQQLNNAGLDVFAAHRNLRLGDRWAQVVPEALAASDAVVLLLTERSGQALFQQEEVLLALDRKLRVIPVWLDGIPSPLPRWAYGVYGVHGLDVPRQGGLRDAGERLVDALLEAGTAEPGAAPAPPPPPPPTPSPPTSSPPNRSPPTYRHQLYAYLQLDRTDQWLRLKEACLEGGSFVFLLHGERRQCLSLFVERAWHWLTVDPHMPHHQGHTVLLRREFALPRSGAAWENHLRAALGGSQGRAGTARDLLVKAARVRPVLVVLGEHPLDRSALVGSDGRPDSRALEGLRAFLQERLPPLLDDPALAHPVRVLLASDHVAGEDPEPLADALDPWLDRGFERCERARYVSTPEVHDVTWDHVQDYLHNRRPRPSSELRRYLKHQVQCLERERASFREFAELLNRHV